MASKSDTRCKTKKVWQKPKLLVLVKIKREDAILTLCKIAALGSPNLPSASQSSCQEAFKCLTACKTTVAS